MEHKTKFENHLKQMYGHANMSKVAQMAFEDALYLAYSEYVEPLISGITSGKGVQLLVEMFPPIIVQEQKEKENPTSS